MLKKLGLSILLLATMPAWCSQLDKIVSGKSDACPVSQRALCKSLSSPAAGCVHEGRMYAAGEILGIGGFASLCQSAGNTGGREIFVWVPYGRMNIGSMDSHK